MNGHLILVTPESENRAQQQFPGRLLKIIENTKTLDDFLAECTAHSILFCAEWPQLTVDVSRALANWAMVKAERGSGLFPLADGEENALPSINFPPIVRETVIELAADTVVTHSIDGHEFESESKHTEYMRQGGEPPLAGLVLTGHGAEYCIQLGDKWLSTFETELLSGPFVFPQMINASTLFLNGCSSMRLGDSVVPKEYSLAFCLFSSGATVIGSFRNMHTSPLYGRIFARALLSGQPLGQIVNMLNRFVSKENGRSAKFQMLGDPCTFMPGTILASECVPSDITNATQQTEEIKTAHLQNMIMHATRLEHVYISLKRWLPETEIFSNDGRKLARSMDFAIQTVNAAGLAELQANDIDLAHSVLNDTCVRFQIDMLGSIADYIQTHGWIQSAYALLSRKVNIRETTCERCGGHAVRTCYEPYVSYLLPVEREECDHCGTTWEKIGAVKSVPAAKIVKNGDSFEITLSPLPKLSEGLLFFHKMPGFPQRVRPKDGGRVTINKKELFFYGRLTLVMSVLGSSGFSVEYHTFFIAPRATTMATRSRRKALANEK